MASCSPSASAAPSALATRTRISAPRPSSSWPGSPARARPAPGPQRLPASPHLGAQVGGKAARAVGEGVEDGEVVAALDYLEAARQAALVPAGEEVARLAVELGRLCAADRGGERGCRLRDCVDR